MTAARRALLVASYAYRDAGLRALTAPGHDAESLAEVLADPQIAGFDVTMLVNEPHHVVGEAIADFYADCHRDDLTLLYFTGHGLKDDDGRLYLATVDTRRNALLFTALAAAQLSDAMDACRSRRKVLVLDCCYSGAFPAGRTSKADEGVHTLERFQGRGRAVLTASDATQYAFEGDDVSGSGARSLFTRHLVEAIRSGEADLDADGDISLDELYSYVHDKVVTELPQQRPKKQEDVDGRIVIARNVHWRLPGHLRHAIESPIAAQRLSALEGLAHLHQVGNETVRATVLEQVAGLADDDSRAVSSAAGALLARLRAGERPVEPSGPADEEPPAAPPPARSRPLAGTAPRADPAPAVAVATPAAAAAVTRRAGVPDAAGGGRTLTGSRRWVPAVVVLAGALLLLSRVTVFESVNGYRAASVGFSTVAWTVGVGLPVLAAAVLLVEWRHRPPALACAAGLLAGAALSLLDQGATSLAHAVDEDWGWGIGPAWWLSAAALALLGTCAVLLAGAPALRGPLTLRGDVVALVSAALVLAALAGWISRFYPDQGPAVTYHSSAVLLAAVCLPVTVVTGGPLLRVLGLTAVTTFGAWVAGTQADLLLTGMYWTDAPDSAVALGCAVGCVAACFLAQFVVRRPARAGQGPQAASSRAS